MGNRLVPRFAATLLVALACCVASSYAAPRKGKARDLGPQFKAAAERVAAQANRFQDVWARVLASRLPKGCRLVRIKCENAVMGSPMVIEFILLPDDTILNAGAYIPKHRVQCAVVEIGSRRSPLAFADKAGNARISGMVRIWMPASVLLGARTEKQEDTWCQLDIRKKGDKLAGTWNTYHSVFNSAINNHEVDAGKKETATAELIDISAGYKLSKNFPEFQPPPGSAIALYSAAVDAEAIAAGRYQMIIMCDVLRNKRQGRDWTYQIPVRPRFVAASQKKGATPKLKGPGPLLDDDLDDLGMGLDDLDGGGDATPAAGDSDIGKHPDAPDRLEQMKNITAHITAMTEMAYPHISGKMMPPLKPVFPKHDDPDFGPWLGYEPLPTAKGKRNILPAYDPAGHHYWNYVDQWQIYGPWKDYGEHAVNQSPIPRALYVPGVTMKAADDVNHRSMTGVWSVPREKAMIRWCDWVTEPGTGMLRPPRWMKGKGSGYGGTANGAPLTRFYAATEIECAQSGNYWVACGVDDDAQVWINGRLVVSWPDPHTRVDMETPIMFRYKFKKGRNTVMARIRTERPWTHRRGSCAGFWMRICVKGGPASPELVAQRKASSKKAKQMSALPKGFQGWRGNLGGYWPDVNPPTYWDPKKDINILWFSPMVHTKSGLLIKGDTLYTIEHPDVLVALDKMTGKEKWRGHINIIELLAPEKSEDYTKMCERWSFLHGVRAFKPYRVPEEEIPKIRTVRGQEINKDDAWHEMQAIRKKHRGEFIQIIRKARQSTGIPWGGPYGLSPSTPATDGKHIWAWSHHGAVACFDMTGKRKWLKMVQERSDCFNTFSSPVIVDTDGDGDTDILLLEPAPEAVKMGGFFMRDTQLTALDAMTGKKLWSTFVYDPGAAGMSTPMRLTNGKQAMTVLISAACNVPIKVPYDPKEAEKLHLNVGRMSDVDTSIGVDPEMAGGQDSGGKKDQRPCVSAEMTLGGTVVRADDGKTLIPNLSLTSCFASPIVHGDVVYHFGNNMWTATKLTMIDRDTIMARRLWTRGWDRDYSFEPGVTYHNGYIYCNLAPAGSAGGQGNHHHGYIVVNAETGDTVTRKVNVSWKQFPDRSCRQYVPMVGAGNYMFFGDDGTCFVKGASAAFAHILVTLARPQPKVISYVGHEVGTKTAPVFDEDRIYVRNHMGIYCVGYKDDKGRAEEAKMNAQCILDDLPYGPPSTAAAVKVEPRPDFSDRIDRQLMFMKPWHGFYKIGLKNEIDVAKYRKAFRSGDLYPDGKMYYITTEDGGRLELQRDRDDGLSYMSEHWNKHCMVMHPAKKLGEKRIEQGEKHFIMYRVFLVKRPRTVRFVLVNKKLDAEINLNGVPLKHDKRYKLEPGFYGQFIYMNLTKAGEDALWPDDSPQFMADFYFMPSDDPEEDVKFYEEQVALSKPYLERVIKLAPDSDEAKQARAALAKLR